MTCRSTIKLNNPPARKRLSLVAKFFCSPSQLWQSSFGPCFSVCFS